MTRHKVSLILFLLVLFVVGIYFIQNKENRKPPKESSKISISATFYPLAFFTQYIGGDKVIVNNLTPAGTEPHDYEPTPKDLAAVYNSKMLVYNGINLEGWVERLLPELQSKNVFIVKASNKVTLYKEDPHIWLDPVLAQQMVTNIQEGLINIDPQNQKYYQQNGNQLISELSALDSQLSATLKNCNQKQTVSSHQVLNYIAQRYQFQTLSIAGLSPDEEPSSQKMVQLVSLVKSKKVQFVLTEPLVNSKLANTLSNETGASVITFNPLEGLTPDQIANKEDYFTIQKQNIINLAKALECPTK